MSSGYLILTALLVLHYASMQAGILTSAIRTNGIAPMPVENAATNATILNADKKEYDELIPKPSRAEQIDINPNDANNSGFLPNFSTRRTGMKVAKRLTAAT